MSHFVLLLVLCHINKHFKEFSEAAQVKFFVNKILKVESKELLYLELVYICTLNWFCVHICTFKSLIKLTYIYSQGQILAI